ncbi:MAG: membrane dipeptidase [Chrysiogenetes bacterium]|nr:membrane dipeptidase [Chrysiogenetes bacterium]
MGRLRYRDYRAEPAAWASELGISREAVDLYLSSEVIDLHTCSFIWSRVFPGYDLSKRHRPFLPGSAFFNQVDFPRAREAQMAGVSWDVTTNPFRPESMRPQTTVKNLKRLAAELSEFPDDYALVRNFTEYEVARAHGKTAALISIQGGQALDYSVESLDLIPDDLVHRITIVHMMRSKIATPSTALRHQDEGLSDFGREFCVRMQEKCIMVDLAHINRKGFFDAVEATDPGIPLVVTHTGISSVRKSWRNLDDEQIRAIAERGGTIGIVYHPQYLDQTWFGCALSKVIDHMEHVINVVGEDFVSLGSDYDGMIWMPRELPDITFQPRMVALMLKRGWDERRIRKILGENFLRVLRAVRP